MTGQRWVASSANYNFKIFYKSSKLNVDADALSQIPQENTQVDCMESLIVKAMLQLKLITNVDIPEVYPQLEVVQKNLIGDSSPKLTNNDWIREQSKGPNISLIIQPLKSEKLKSCVTKEMDSSELHVLLKYHKDQLLKNGLLYQKVLLKNHPEPISQFVLPKCFVCKVILACHDDSGHLDMEGTLGLLQERFFWPKWQMMCTFTYAHVISVPGSSNLRKKQSCNQYWFLILWS